MLREIQRLLGMELHTGETEVGRISDVYFDYELWHVRYFVVDTGSWLAGRTVLIAPVSVIARDWHTGKLMTDLTRDQVRHSPAVDMARPVSRQSEQDLHDHYGWPYYWGAPTLSGSYGTLMSRTAAPVAIRSAKASEDGSSGEDPSTREYGSHLRSARSIRGYHIAATDHSIGHLDDLVVEDETWALRYLVVDTRNWWPGKKVLLGFSQIRGMSWEEGKIYVSATSDDIKAFPDYESGRRVEADYVDRLDAHYNKDAT